MACIIEGLIFQLIKLLFELLTARIKDFYESPYSGRLESATCPVPDTRPWFSFSNITTLKGKDTPVETWTDLRFPGGCGFQISRQTAHEGGKVVSPTHRPPLPPRKYPRYSFLLEAESTPVSWWGRKDCVNENSYDVTTLEVSNYYILGWKIFTKNQIKFIILNYMGHGINKKNGKNKKNTQWHVARQYE